MDATLASYFAAREARTKAAMVLFNRMSRRARSRAKGGSTLFSGAFSCLMFAPLVMIGSQIVGMALFALGCVFFFVGLDMLTRADSLANSQLTTCFGVIDSDEFNPEFIAAMKKYAHQRVQEEWDPLFG
jgi:hypothetical protein